MVRKWTNLAEHAAETYLGFLRRTRGLSGALHESPAVETASCSIASDTIDCSEADSPIGVR